MAQIEIKGIIGEDYTYARFLTDYAAAGVEPIRLSIASVGGAVEDGEEIANFISSHADRFLTVSNSGDVASIAASIFLSLPREKRFFDLNKGVFLIHNPFLDPFSLAFSHLDTTAEGIRMIADELQETESRIAKFIEKQTGADIDVIKGLMKINQPLSQEQLQALNIATVYQYQAVAFLKPLNTNKMTQEELTQKLEENNVTLFSLIKAWMKKTTKFVAVLLTDATGAQIEFTDVPDGVDPVVGDTARYTDGSIPDGDVVMADGSTVTFENGTVTAILPKAEEVETEPEAAVEPNAEIEALKAEIEKLKSDKVAMAAQVVEIKAMIKSQGIDPLPADAPEGDVIPEPKKIRKISEIVK